MTGRRQRVAETPPKALTLEALFTSPRGFGVTTATPAQRAICRIADGLPLGDLELDPDVQWAIWGSDPPRWDELPRTPPAELGLYSGVRTGKSLFAAALAFRASQVTDVSGLGAGEIPRVSVLSLDKDKADAVVKHLVGAIEASTQMRALRREPAEFDLDSNSVVLMHPSGRPVEIMVVAGKRAGGAVVSRWSAGVIFDEAPRMLGSDDGVVNLEDTRDASLGRVLPGAQIVELGSPWAPFGPVYEQVQERWKRPGKDLVVIRPRAWAMNPVWWTPERCAELKAKNPRVYKTDVEGEFADLETTLYLAERLRELTRRGGDEPARRGYTYAAFMDPATRSNAWTLVICGYMEVPLEGSELRLALAQIEAGREASLVKGYLHVALAREWIPKETSRLDPEEVLPEIAKACALYGLTTAGTDQWAPDALAAVARRSGLRLEDSAWTGANKVALFTNLETYVSGGRIDLPTQPHLIDDLASVRKRVTQEGVKIVLPKSSDGRHCDFAPALAGAVERARAGAGIGRAEELSDANRGFPLYSASAGLGDDERGDVATWAPNWI